MDTNIRRTWLLILSSLMTSSSFLQRWRVQGRVSGVKMGSQPAFASHFQPKMPNASTRHLDLPHEISPFLSLSHPLSDKYSPLVSLHRLTSPRSDAPGALSGQVRSEWEILTMMMLLNYAILLSPPSPTRSVSRTVSGFFGTAATFFRPPSHFLVRNTLSRVQGLLK